MEMKLLLYLGNQNKSEPFEKVQQQLNWVAVEG